MAILLVLGQHAPTKPLANGYVGVTVFFCLSGYLITTLLVRELDSGGLDLRAFFRRRAARLGPALLAVVTVTSLVLVVDRRDLGLGEVLAPAGTALAYATNLYDWTGRSFATYDYFNYTWSLSIEEQFYLLWPVALLWGYRTNRRRVTGFTLALVVISLGLNLFLGLSHEDKFDAHEYFGSDTNVLPILVGCLLAMVVHNGWLSRPLRGLAPWAPLSLPLLAALAYRNDADHTSLVRVVGTGLALALLTGVVAGPRSVVGSLLAAGPMRWLGERSYSIYLWNVLARIAVLHWLGHTVVGDLAWTALVVVLGEASFRFVERPMRARLAGKPREPAPTNVGAYA